MEKAAGLIQYLCYEYGSVLTAPPVSLFGTMHTTSSTSFVRAMRLHDGIVAAVCLDSVSEDYKEMYDTREVMDALCAELSRLKTQEDALE